MSLKVTEYWVTGIILRRASDDDRQQALYCQQLQVYCKNTL